MNNTVIIAAVIVFIVAAIGLWLILKSRNLHIWILPYIRQRIQQRRNVTSGDTHVYFCFVDHYEPYMLNNDDEIAAQRVDDWVEQYPKVADKHEDSFGQKPRHSFFYPVEEYRPHLMQKLAALCNQGYGEVEVHLHHDNDTAENLKNTLVQFKTTLYDEHGLLRKDPVSGEVIYAFIHGNWALDNSRPDGRWCGVDNELSVLEETGCYVDMTMPSAPSDTQTSKINSIYWAKGCDGCRKSHNRGRDLRKGERKRPGELLMVQGPLMLNWKRRKMGLMPKIESGEISYDSPPAPERPELWEQAAVCVKGLENHIFIKVHTHGGLEKNYQMLFDQGFDDLWTSLEQRFRDRKGYKLHYVTAWEMVQAIEGLVEITAADK